LAQVKEKEDTTDTDTVYIPVNIDEAMTILDRTMDSVDKLNIKLAPEDSAFQKLALIASDIPDFFYDWKLAYPKLSPITQYLNRLGIVYGGYDCTKAIIISFHRYLNNLPINIQQIAASIRDQRAIEYAAYIDAQNRDTPISLSKFFNVPFPSDSLFDKYGWADTSWIVHRIGDLIYASIGRMHYDDSILPSKIAQKFRNILGGRISVCRVDNGFLVGLYRGEFGRGLYWFSKDGNGNYKVSDDEIVGFARHGTKFFAVEGLAHLNYDGGTLIEIKKIKGKWTSVLFKKLPSAPYGIVVRSNGNFVVMTSLGLLDIDSKGRLSYLIQGTQFPVYPSALVKDNSQTVYVGMRAGILTYNLVSGIKGWLVYSKEPKLINSHH
jgi:hypothetical protein